jgi:phosphonopyruvate decarboxylase
MKEPMDPKNLYDAFIDNGVSYFTGVPDSLLAPFISCVESSNSPHHIAVNEGHSVALAIGSHIANGTVPVVYMQNSGIGNAINPLVSLADPKVMSIPMVLLIGWRGQPGAPDEPQHIKQGEITHRLLEALDIPITVLSHDSTQMRLQVADAMQGASKNHRAYALLVESDLLQANSTFAHNTSSTFTREDAIQTIIDTVPANTHIVSTTGKASRELFEYRNKKNVGHEHDLQIVGGMGHASAIAQSIAYYATDKEIIVLDGDGAALMHMGTLAYNGVNGTRNFCHIVLNNGAHESVGGQKTIAQYIDLTAIAAASGYRTVKRVNIVSELIDALQKSYHKHGPTFIEVVVSNSSRKELSRPSISPEQNKLNFIDSVRS